MYCVIESPKLVNLPVVDIAQIKCIRANRENVFLCIITPNDIMIWFSPVSGNELYISLNSGRNFSFFNN